MEQYKGSISHLSEICMLPMVEPYVMGKVLRSYLFVLQVLDVFQP